MHLGTREAQLAAALLEASDTLSDGFGAERYLQRLSDHCVEILDARAAGIMLIEGGEAVSLAVSSRQQEAALDLLAVQQHGGPCLDSYATGRPVPPVSVSAAHAASRWPGFTRAALRHDIAATFAVPLRRRETLLGALNVFLPELPAPEDDGSVRVAQLLADAAAVGLQNHRVYAQYRTLAEQLQVALSSRVRVEQAKGMLAERWDTGVDEAFMALRRYARRHRLPLDEVATRVLDGSVDRDDLGGHLRE
ncbi:MULTISPECIES: GAF and ANTAR domain-containing protein [Streptomyces]|uniref:ANTAR domain-containing protein n=1 Tax=Streptomyces dengpaensis TaxID=2049881 RepID=A0ABN5I655_9ACTN|nr:MULTISPECIES: ANTAR domain-containing protein [Streptomyces]AVH58553.1 ANTAR domain-containing protein [Streptomyces dengpaensis]PIB11387.1 response regulator receiver protein [Streptomyces sp. HG99]